MEEEYNRRKNGRDEIRVDPETDWLLADKKSRASAGISSPLTLESEMDQVKSTKPTPHLWSLWSSSFLLVFLYIIVTKERKNERGEKREKYLKKRKLHANAFLSLHGRALTAHLLETNKKRKSKRSQGTHSIVDSRSLLPSRTVGVQRGRAGASNGNLARSCRLLPPDANV